jgi:hypothetical protein
LARGNHCSASQEGDLVSSFDEEDELSASEDEEEALSDASEEDSPGVEVDDSLFDEEEMEDIMRNLASHEAKGTTARSVTLSSFPEQSRMCCQLEKSTIVFRPERHSRET